MQGGYKLTAEISRRIIELVEAGKLSGILHFKDNDVQAMVRGYAKEVTDMLNAEYGACYSRTPVTSTIQHTLPELRGGRFLPYKAPETLPVPETQALRDRVEKLEAEFRELHEYANTLVAEHNKYAQFVDEHHGITSLMAKGCKSMDERITAIEKMLDKMTTPDEETSE